jgi:DNA-binding transcriptional MerR regulator
VIVPEDGESAAGRRLVKSEAAFRTISEVSEDLAVPQHVLRFWESKFPQIKPLKRGGGRRYYRPEDLHLLKRIRDFLYKDGYTIRGVQKLLRELSRDAFLGGASEELRAAAEAPAEGADAEPEADDLALHCGEHLRVELEDLVEELEGLRRLLGEARSRSGSGK